MKTFIITASITKFYEATIEAETHEEANEIAKNMCGSDFELVRGRYADELGNWTIENVEEVKS